MITQGLEVEHPEYGKGQVDSITSSGSSVWVIWEKTGSTTCHPLEDILPHTKQKGRQ